MKFLITLLILAFATCVFVPAQSDYSRIEALFQKHCLDCHNAKDAEGQLILESYDLLMKGGEDGAVIIPGKSAESILVKSIEGSFEKDGKRKIMPPGAKRKKLDSEEIALIKAWIDAGAKGPSGPRKPVELVTLSSTTQSAFGYAPRCVPLGRLSRVDLKSQSL